ncbi:NAD(P)/FAD-dependent oxidoreductase [Salegentibacter salarius]|uniref:Oxidoreductase n=1 Tax=Salegentibacter salarius TaxID=435906 RepID=A0A2N0TMS1_9FLAO|nr:NAD(P)/FAD-dependent oxidoreductase [Salegentibacter salarius]OEY71396.1 oxidoreductase [Salegentibacter salarius]PKD16033.1 oxidoreductase [Salegentibacter salarius]SLJ91862.1 Flavin containing amine oxidoreductase [Salegentibacter salarius]
MEKSEYKIKIVGAGLSGLIAAKVLEDHGYAPEIYEASDSVGGRIKTDLVEGYQLDRGFQVLLSAYPKALQYLDYQSLELQELLPGAVIYENAKLKTIGDPLRASSLIMPTIFSGIGTFSDKLKILSLYTDLKKLSVNDIFERKETTTLAYLQEKGFSEEIISKFFKPFFSGIYLEPNLETSSRMFEFVFKMFGEGLAVIPKKGMGEISKNLARQLKNTKIHLNTPVKQVKEGEIILENQEVIPTNATIIATEASALVSNLKNQETQWKSCHSFYFETEKRTIEKPIIGLISDKDAMINNIFYHTSVATESHGEKELLSVTVVKQTDLSEAELLKKVEEDLKNYCRVGDARFLKHYFIKKALPKISPLHYEIDPTETQLTDTIFLAGDQLLNSSQNAAMLSGERAAFGLIQGLKK